MSHFDNNGGFLMVAKGCDSHRCRWEQNAIYVVLWQHGDVVEYAGLI